MELWLLQRIAGEEVKGECSQEASLNTIMAAFASSVVVLGSKVGCY